MSGSPAIRTIRIPNYVDFDDLADAVRIANGTQYGLVGGVFTKDLDRATTVARDMKAGQIFVNEWFAGGVETKSWLLEREAAQGRLFDAMEVGRD